MILDSITQCFLLCNFFGHGFVLLLSILSLDSYLFANDSCLESLKVWSNFLLCCVVIQFNCCKHFFGSCVVHKTLCGKCHGRFHVFHYVCGLFALYHSLGIWTLKAPKNLECQGIKKKIAKTTQEEKGFVSTLKNIDKENYNNNIVGSNRSCTMPSPPLWWLVSS